MQVRDTDVRFLSLKEIRDLATDHFKRAVSLKDVRTEIENNPVLRCDLREARSVALKLSPIERNPSVGLLHWRFQE